MEWDDFKVKTTPKCPRGTIYMHPDDAAVMRPLTLGAIVGRLVKGTRLPPAAPDQYRGHCDSDDDAARARVRRQLEELKARRAAGGNEG